MSRSIAFIFESTSCGVLVLCERLQRLILGTLAAKFSSLFALWASTLSTEYGSTYARLWRTLCAAVCLGFKRLLAAQPQAFASNGTIQPALSQFDIGLTLTCDLSFGNCSGSAKVGSEWGPTAASGKIHVGSLVCTTYLNVNPNQIKKRRAWGPESALKR